jgi:hypothetical protein
VDKVTLGTAVDMTASYDGSIAGGLQNGTSAPAVAAQVWFGQAPANTEAQYSWRPIAAGDVTVNSWTPFSITLKPGWFYNIAVCRNTTNAVDCTATAIKITAV